MGVLKKYNAETDQWEAVSAQRRADWPTAVTMDDVAALEGVTGNIQEQLGGKQPTLVSGTSIKTVNSVSLLGEGDIAAGLLIIHTMRASNTILDAADKGKLIDITSGTFTQTITAATTLGDGWFCYFKNSGTGVITIDPSGSETIGGVATAECNTGDTWLIQCDGANFTLMRLAGNNTTTYTSGVNTFTVPAGVTRIYVECWGGGGGGAKSPNAVSAGAGGGGYSAGWISVTPGATITATVGAGGSGGTTDSSAGGTGGTTTFGTLSASGGTGAAAQPPYTNPIYSIYAGGNASGGTLNIKGGCGFSAPLGSASSFYLSRGGDSPHGGQGGVSSSGYLDSIYQNTTAAASAPGGGGYGGVNASSGNVNGGNGGAGQITVRWG